jgi:hypothetical protein
MLVRLGTLLGSESNRLYQRHGLVKTDETKWDILYKRQPRLPAEDQTEF